MCPGELAHETRRLTELALVGTAASHRERNAVRGEDHFGQVSSLFRYRVPSGAEKSRQWLNEARVVVEDAQLVEPHVRLAERFQRTVDVFAVLAAARVGAIGGGDEEKYVVCTVGMHRGQRVLQEGMP